MFGRRARQADTLDTATASLVAGTARTLATWTPGPVPEPVATPVSAWSDAWLTADDARAWRER